MSRSTAMNFALSVSAELGYKRMYSPQPIPALIPQGLSPTSNISSMSPQVPKSAAAIYGANEKRSSNISISSTTLRPRSINHPGIVVPSKAPPTTSVSNVLATVNPSIREARNENYHGNPIQTEMPLVTPEHPSIDHEDGAVQDSEARLGVDSDVPFSTEAPTIAMGLYSVVCRDGDMESEDVPSISLFQGSSNFQISNTNINAIGGNATIIRFGDGQFTQIQRNLICDYIANLTVLPDINENVKKHVLTQAIISLPRAEAVFNDYQTKKKSGPCFEGTRVALLREMAGWATGSDQSRMYILSGLAGIGKSTVAYTIASRAAHLNLLGASFFFSRDEAGRNNAKSFFTTIAYQLCVYDETFATAIGDVLKTERGSAAITKDPEDQLQALILDPLRSVVQLRARPVLVIVDALDECNEDDERVVVMGLSQLVRQLPSFKVILTTRPQPLVDYLFGNHDGHEIFHLQDIEDKVVDGDIRLYLSHSFSQEQVRGRLLNPKGQWCASEEDIECLVMAAGRLFIVASTAVLYVLNKTLGDPGARMKKLLGEIAQDRTPFHALNHFYSIIVRSAIQVDDDDDDNEDIVDRYQIIVGTIVAIQTPLPVATLAYFIGQESEQIYAMLRNLQSVISLGGDDVPRIYHKSFPDYLTDQARCKDPHLRIDPRIRHTQIAIRCFEIMDKHLKRNILGLGDPARFMSNEDGLKEDGITDEQMQEKIPQRLRYACVYWVNHFEFANIEDVHLMGRLEKFVAEHMLYWFEVLSLIGKLDLAHCAIGVVLKVLKSRSSDSHQLLSDALRFISKFYGVVERSALHTYYSALAFTPTNSLLYCRYIKETADNICSVEGGPEKWSDALVATLNHGELINAGVYFSLDGTLFCSCSAKVEDSSLHIHNQGKLKIWDAATGTPVSTIPGHMFAVANDFSTVASSEDRTITFYNVDGSVKGTILTTSSEVQNLALSSESSRVAAALSDGTVWLWDIGNAELIDCFDGCFGRLQFSPTGTRLTYLSANGIVKLRDGISGKLITDLQCGSSDCYYVEFSDDGSRVASLSPDDSLTLWNSESGALIGAVRDSAGGVLRCLTISANGSLLATADHGKATLWSESNDSLVQIEVLKIDLLVLLILSPHDTLLLGTVTGIRVYDVKTRAFISTLPFRGMPMTVALSPDCTHFAVGNFNGGVYLWDIRGIDASSPPSPSKGYYGAAAVTALALSPDCSRLACGFGRGMVEVWGTSPPNQRIGPLALSKMKLFRRACHTKAVRALEFSPDGRLFASGSVDRTVKLWKGKGLLRGTLEVPAELRGVALSHSLLVAGYGDSNVALWSLDTLSLIHTFETSGNSLSAVSIAENSAFIAVVNDDNGTYASDIWDNVVQSVISLLDVTNHTTIATFDIPYRIHTLTFLPDNSQLVAQSSDGVYLSLNLMNKHITRGPPLEDVIQLPDTSLWYGVPIWHCQNKDQHYFSALFPRHQTPVPVLWIPSDLHLSHWTQKSSMIALGCRDGRIILLRPPTS